MASDILVTVDDRGIYKCPCGGDLGLITIGHQWAAAFLCGSCQKIVVAVDVEPPSGYNFLAFSRKMESDYPLGQMDRAQFLDAARKLMVEAV